jgi:hypothetical protein
MKITLHAPKDVIVNCERLLLIGPWSAMNFRLPNSGTWFALTRLHMLFTQVEDSAKIALCEPFAPEYVDRGSRLPRALGFANLLPRFGAQVVASSWRWA